MIITAETANSAVPAKLYVEPVEKGKRPRKISQIKVYFL